MGSRKVSLRKPNQKLNMTRRMRSLILQLSLIGLVSIVYLILIYSSITVKYSKITNEIYQEVERMSALNESLYQHQALVFEHIIASTDMKKAEIETNANNLAKSLRQLLSEFGDTTTGGKYEVYYHNIYSGIVGYLKNVDIIFDFSRNGEIETAQYYMENVLEDYLNSVNGTMQTMDNITKQDMQDAKEKMEHDTDMVRLSSYILLGILIMFSILAQVIGYRVSDMMVNVDAVTGIINYNKFIERLENFERRGQLAGKVLLSLNIKGFQYINQQLGNHKGDQVLRKYAEVLKNKIDKNNLIARASSDGFVMLLDEESLNEFLAFLEDITLDIELDSEADELQAYGKIAIRINSRCGYYLVEEGVSYLKALENVALALKLAREIAESDQVCYEEKMFEQKIVQTQIVHEFRDALEENEFIVYYQPKVNINDNSLCGAEALVRWFHDDHIIPPTQFIPVLEQEGYVVDLDFYMLNTVCAAIKSWLNKGHQMVPISVNFSKSHLKDDMFAERILQIVNEHQVNPEYIEIELTETVGDEDYDELSNFVDKMKEAKIRTSIDDFGTGYSSLALIRTVDVDTVKISRSFIEDVTDEMSDSTDEKLVSNIVHMINDLGKNAICVGVETIKQAEFLRNAKCYQAQGFLFDRPLPPEEFEQRLIRQNY